MLPARPAHGTGVKTMTTSTLKTPRAPKTRTATGPVEVRAGRPPKELAGEVDARILDAAREVFLERGFEGASIDEIAEAARSGKRTIYARFRDKRALFTEVVTRDILSRIAEFKADAPLGATVEERLTSVASTLLHWGLDADRIGLMRLAIAEAHRFPERRNIFWNVRFRFSWSMVRLTICPSARTLIASL